MSNLYNSLVAVISIEIEIEQKRLELIDRSCIKAFDMIKLNERAQSRSAAEVRSHCESDRRKHEVQLNELSKLKKQIEEKSDRQISGALISLLNETCKSNNCFEILGKINKNLANDLMDISTSIIVNNWDRFGFEPRAHQHEASSAVSDLLLKKWVCERQLAYQTYSTAIDGKALGNCFATVLFEEALKAGRTPNIFETAAWSLPINDNLPKATPAHKKTREFVENQGNYTLLPWDLFRECSKEIPSLKGALILCYEVLRLNRMRPDFQRKLFDLRGDRSLGGDNSGDWYHLFGMAFTGVRFGPATKVLYWFEPKIEEDENFLASHESEIKEVRADLAGADAGIAATDRLIALKKSQRHLPSETLCNPRIFNIKPN